MCKQSKGLDIRLCNTHHFSHGCNSKRSALGRALTSRDMQTSMKALHSAVHAGMGLAVPSFTFFLMSSIVLAAKGAFPPTSSQASTPTAHTSTPVPYPCTEEDENATPFLAVHDNTSGAT